MVDTRHSEETVLSANEIAVVGVPFDRNSSFRRGAALAPRRIREALRSESANLWTESGVDLESASRWHMTGDVDCSDYRTAFTRIERHLRALLKHRARVISLGGDHSITYPLLRAYGQAYPDLTLIHLDAHPDLYRELDGNPYSHACPFARIMEEKLARRLVQVGIRTLTGHQREQARRFGVEMIEMREIHRVADLRVEGPFYLSLDLDCLDPAFAPGVSHYEPGGLSTREVLNIIHRLPGNLVGADIVEYNPERDPQGITAMVAGKLLKEILGRMVNEI
jgi:arginase